MVDILATELQECSWRGISFPIEMVGEKGGQRIVVHNKMDRAGAQIESTGRMPYQFTIKAFFIEGLTQGIYETWANLFPETWINIRNALERKDTGTLVHPLYGNVECKPVNWSANINADSRGGMIVDMEFIETIDDTDGSTTLEIAQTPGTTAKNLDTAFLSVGFKVPTSKMLGQNSFFDALNFLNSLQDNAIGFIDNLIDQVFSIMSTISDLIDPLASLFDAMYAFINSLTDIKLKKFNIQKETAIYTVGFDTTVPSVAGFVGNTLEHIIQLNPTLVHSVIVPHDTKVIYYTTT